jgi:hypothetical protein
VVFKYSARAPRRKIVHGAKSLGQSSALPELGRGGAQKPKIKKPTDQVGFLFFSCKKETNSNDEHERRTF